jgi:CRISPR-associated protein Csm4
MKLSVCNLKPKGPLHLGERENWREGSGIYIHSDTLFSAFCHCYQFLYSTEELEKLLKLFEDNQPPFLFSSAFPCWKGLYYFPVPLNQFPGTKEVKKIKFIEKAGLEKLLAGEKIESLISDYRCIPSHEKPAEPWVIENTPRVSLNRRSNHPLEEGGFFHFGLVFYHPDDAELYFLIQYKNSDYKKRVEATIRLIADEGIGGDRSSGKGLFHYPVFSEINLDIPSEYDGIMTLSLYFPNDDELTGIKDGFYELIERKGYIYSPVNVSLRRKSERMFTEGSVFPKSPERKGKLVNVTPNIFTNHSVYRYGLIFALPCKLESK